MSATTLERPAQDEAAIRTLISEWSRALEAKDVDALTAKYSPDAVLYDVKPPYKTVGPAAIKQLWQQCLPYFPKTFKSEHRDLKISVSGDLAVVYGLHHMVIPDEPNHPAGQSWLRVTACYEKVDGQWRVMHEHVSMPFDCTTGQVSPITNADVG